MFFLIVLLDHFGSEEDSPHREKPLQTGQTGHHHQHQREDKEQFVQATVRLTNKLIIKMATGVVVYSCIVREC